MAAQVAYPSFPPREIFLTTVPWIACRNTRDSKAIIRILRYRIVPLKSPHITSENAVYAQYRLSNSVDFPLISGGCRMYDLISTDLIFKLRPELRIVGILIG